MNGDPITILGSPAPDSEPFSELRESYYRSPHKWSGGFLELHEENDAGDVHVSSQPTFCGGGDLGLGTYLKFFLEHIGEQYPL